MPPRSRNAIDLKRGLIFACAMDGAADFVDLVTGAAPTVTGTPTTAAGLVRASTTVFDGASGYVYPVRSDLQRIQQMTITAWIRNDNARDATYRTAVGIGNARFATQVADLFWRSSGSSGASLYSSTSWRFVAGTILQFTNPVTIPGNNKWSMVLDPSNSSRSELLQALASASDAPTSSSQISVGQLKGALNNVCIWNRALSYAEIDAARIWDLRRN